MPDTAIAEARAHDTEVDAPQQRPWRRAARRAGIALIAVGVVLTIAGVIAYLSASSARTEIDVIRAERESLEDDLAELNDTTLASALRATDIDAFSSEVLDALTQSRTAREQVETVFADAVTALDRRESSKAQEIVGGDAAAAVEAERSTYEQLAAAIKSLDDRLAGSVERNETPSPDEGDGE